MTISLWRQRLECGFMLLCGIVLCAYYRLHAAMPVALGGPQLTVLHQRASFEPIRVYPLKAY